MFLAEALRNMPELERRSLADEIDAMCVQRFPVINLLRQHLPTEIVPVPVRFPIQLMAFTVFRMIAIDKEFPEDEAWSVLPEGAATDLDSLAAYVAIFAKALLREALPIGLRELSATGRLESLTATLIPQAADLFAETRRHERSPRNGGVWRSAENGPAGSWQIEESGEGGALTLDVDLIWHFAGVLQATKFAKDKDIELWDFAAAIYDLGPSASSGTGISWSLTDIADCMNLDPVLQVLTGTEHWTPERLKNIAARFDYFADQIRTPRQHQNSSRVREQESCRLDPRLLIQGMPK